MSLGLIMRSSILICTDWSTYIHILLMLRNSIMHWSLIQNKTTNCKTTSNFTKYYLSAHDAPESSIGDTSVLQEQQHTG